MRKSRIIAALLTGIVLCNSVPLSTWASDQDVVFDDGESDISAEEPTELSEEEPALNESSITEESGEETDVFTEEVEFTDDSEDEFSDSANVESSETFPAEAADVVSDAVWNGHYYKVYDSSMNWTDAKKYCEKQNGHLVTITSAEEQAKVSSLISNGSKNFYWLGAERNYLKNGFDRWITGESITYSNYDRSNNEPNNFTGKENVLVIYRIKNPKGGYDGQYKWNDLQKDGDCNGEAFFGYQNSGFICEWDSEQIDDDSKYNPEIYNKVQNFLANTNYSPYPLLEYDDPVKLAAGFSNTPGGVLQLFIKRYGDLHTNNMLCEQEYEEVLVDLLADASFLKRLTDGWDKDLGDIAAELEETVLAEANDKLNIAMGAFTDTVRNNIKNNVGKILVLSSIADNAVDENLRKACQVCMADYFNSTFREIGEVLIGKAVDMGKDYLSAKQMVQNQILSTSLKKGFLDTIIQNCSLGTVSSLVSGILFVKDVISYASGINKRVDNYMKTVSLNFIYSASAEAYAKKVSAIKAGDRDMASDAYILFQFMLRVKQEAYKNMQGMFTSSTWNSILDSDPYLKKNAGKIKKITIGNYVKNKLGHLEPKAQTTKLSLKVSDKKKFSCTGISYLSNVKYVSNNSKVAKVSSSGVIQAKKPGTAYIRCKIEQYGNTYELKCKVTVKNKK